VRRIVLPPFVIVSDSVNEYCGAAFQFAWLFSTDRRTMSRAFSTAKAGTTAAASTAQTRRLWLESRIHKIYARKAPQSCNSLSGHILGE
jgi:hypothetical protein